MRTNTADHAALGPSRTRVLTVLQDAGEPLAADAVAERVGLHANAARFHLDALVQAGLAERAVEDRDQPGRPRTLYTSRPDATQAGKRSYRLLSEILTSYLAAEVQRPAEAALRAGQAWGRYLADKPAPFRRVDADAATAELLRVLDDIGFAPEAASNGRQRRVLLHHCPFRETAEEHRQVVCPIHLGLMQGLLTEIGSPIEPGLCVGHLTAASGKPAKRKHRGAPR